MAGEAGYRLSVEKRESPKGEPASGPSRLPRGRHGLPRDLVLENQRERLVAGIIEAVAEHGYNETTIAAITKAAGVSRPTFYAHFENKEACFAAAYEASFEYARETMLKGAALAEEWPERVRGGLAALLAVFAADADLAAFFLIAPASAGDEIADRHHEAMRNIVSALTSGAPVGPGETGPSETREQALAGGLSRLIVRKLAAAGAAELRELLPDLVELILQPYVGSEEAIRVARKAAED
jgi:AcrR family transcriptional regulator